MLSAVATAVNAEKRKRRTAAMAAMANIPGRLAPDIGAVAVADFTLEFKR